MILAQVTDHTHEIHAHHVAAETEEKRLPQAKETGVTPKQINRNREQGVTKIFTPKIDREIADYAVGIEQRKNHDEEQTDDADGDQFSFVSGGKG